MTTRRLAIHTFNVYSRALWFALAAVTVVSEVVPSPHTKPLFFYGLYSPAKLICFLALGFLTPLVSRAVNRHQIGSIPDQPCHYGQVFTSRDVYGDVIFCGRKPIQSVRSSYL